MSWAEIPRLSTQALGERLRPAWTVDKRQLIPSDLCDSPLLLLHARDIRTSSILKHRHRLGSEPSGEVQLR